MVHKVALEPYAFNTRQIVKLERMLRGKSYPTIYKSWYRSCIRMKSDKKANKYIHESKI